MCAVSNPTLRTHNIEWQLLTASLNTHTMNYAVNTEWCLFFRSMCFLKKECLFAPR
jgi:hypothetical protein